MAARLASFDKTALGAHPDVAECAVIGVADALKDVAVVAAPPKARSGKILRKTMRGIADGLDTPTPSTVDEPSVIEALRLVLRRADHTL